MRLFIKTALFVSGLIGVVCAAHAEGDAPESCEAKYEALAPVAIKMPFREFDQSPEGWRKLGNCWAESSLLLRRYALKLEYEVRGIRWHLAQTLALNGDTAAAIESALLSLQPPELQQRSNFGWNTYALATIALLRDDRAAFDTQFEAHRIAAAAHPENNTNLEVLTRMAGCFGTPRTSSPIWGRATQGPSRLLS